MSNRSLLLAPCLLIACAEDTRRDADDPTLDAEIDQVEPAMEMFFTARNGTCGAPRLLVEAHARIGGGLVENAICEFAFDDGPTVFARGSEAYGCEVEVELPRSGDNGVTVMIRDPETDAVGTLHRPVFVYPVLTADLEVTAPACGLELSWKATAPEASVVNVFVAPSEDAIADDELYYMNREYTLGVTEAGTYRIDLFAEQLRSSGGSCIVGLTKYVTVTECDHEHTSGCGH